MVFETFRCFGEVWEVVARSLELVSESGGSAVRPMECLYKRRNLDLFVFQKFFTFSLCVLLDIPTPPRPTVHTFPEPTPPTTTTLKTTIPIN